jgi:hypothetical protein
MPRRTAKQIRQRAGFIRNTNRSRDLEREVERRRQLSDAQRLAIIDVATSLEGTNEVQFDVDAEVKDTGSGYWVQAWHYFDYEEIDG